MEALLRFKTHMQYLSKQEFNQLINTLDHEIIIEFLYQLLYESFLKMKDPSKFEAHLTFINNLIRTANKIIQRRKHEQAQQENDVAGFDSISHSHSKLIQLDELSLPIISSISGFAII